MQTEARIACNPSASPLLMNVKNTDKRLPKRAEALSTSTHKNQELTSTSETLEKPKTPCLFCKDETHGVVKCPTFAAKTVDEKKAFIHDNHLCFGCLRKGHIAKDCKMRHTCSTCGRRHPTFLHIERNRSPVESASKDPIASGDHTSKDCLWSTSSGTHLDRHGNESSVHRVEVKEMPVFTDVLKVLESDFNDRSYEDRYMSQDDVRFIQLLNNNIKQKRDGHFEIPLPFRGSGPPVLPNNKKLATIQLQHLNKKFKANKQYFDHYTAFMEKNYKEW
ncbi:Zinc finger CCHC domain-containing protein 13 [Labeo rohita]|uniref:Zinc finger CCHC domain-containing protein 13 n=1 Tax=Labeo rohita TaxID=84645 RepID=A0ABQ8L3D6_LABRO|nr:Zinc finger CCHC domain-containing protein 13 [Labeo rohita]